VGHQAGLTHGATYARYEDVDELLVDLWTRVLRTRIEQMHELCMSAAREPGEATLDALFDFLQSTTPTDVAGVHVLLTARRITALHEEIEPWIQQHLEENPATTSAVFARGMCVFAMLLVQTFAEGMFNWDPQDRVLLQNLLLETLNVEQNDVPSVALMEDDLQIVLAPDDDLRAQLSNATFGVVGRSGYMHATISRIARRANCSPGAIYKLYPSKEDLVIAAFHDLMHARWMRVSTFIDLREEGAITQLFYSAASRRNSIRQNFTLETALAAAHSDKLRTAIISQLSELDAVIPLLSDINDEDKLRLRFFMRAITLTTIGVTFLATVSPTLENIQFNQFAEPFRQSILKDFMPTWTAMCEQLFSLINARGF
jgi:AcrR family transcriptional regulator